jgi:inhibitor of cysteine peptidase
MRTNIKRLFALIVIFSVAIVLVSCNSAEEEPESAEPTSAAISSTESYEAPVDGVEILVMESFPVQINVIASGTLPDGCSTIDPDIVQTQQDTTFNVTINAVRPVDVVCTAEAAPFQEIISLDVDGLPAGSYAVDVNGATAGFTLDVDNVVAEEPTAAPEPTAEPTPTTAIPVGTSTINGTVWHDLCAVIGGQDNAIAIPGAGCVAVADGYSADGAREAEEPTISGVVVSLYADACPGSELVTSTATAPDGTYTFDGLAAGSYCVTIETADDPNATILEPGLWTAPTATEAPGAISVELGEDALVANLDFGWDYELLPEPDVVENEEGCIDIVSFGADVTVPDDSPFEVGSEFVKTWRLINAGSCNWGPGYALVFVGGEQMDAPDLVPLKSIARTGETVDVSIPFVTPAETGFYRSEWQLQTPSGELLGLDSRPAEVLWTQIEAVEAGTLGSVTGFMWDDVCDQSAYTFGTDTPVPPGCTLNTNGTVRGDSVYDSAEPVMPGIIVTLGSGECGTAETITVTLTDDQGVYSFDSLLPGTYCVFVDVIEEGNFEQLWPGNFTFPAPGKAGTTVLIEGGQEISNINFAWDFADVVEEEAGG